MVIYSFYSIFWNITSQCSTGESFRNFLVQLLFRWNHLIKGGPVRVAKVTKTGTVGISFLNGLGSRSMNWKIRTWLERLAWNPTARQPCLNWDKRQRGRKGFPLSWYTAFTGLDFNWFETLLSFGQTKHLELLLFHEVVVFIGLENKLRLSY